MHSAYIFAQKCLIHMLNITENELDVLLEGLYTFFLFF